jgi:predicted nucleic acid-binding protein
MRARKRATLQPMLLLITTLWLSSAASGSAAPASLPKVYLLYPAPDGSVFDRNCSDTLKDAPVIDRKWIDETVRRAPEFQRSWDAEGPAYLTTTFDAIGLAFPYVEMQAALTVCPVLSMSLPLMINVRRFLASAGNRTPDWFLPMLVFHELMHTYTRPVNTTSALRKKHASEPALVLNHLHVLALEKFVLTKLGKADELKWLDQSYRTTAPPAYKRAWEIVNDEGVDAFLNELKAAAR